MPYKIIVLKGEGNFLYNTYTEREARFAAELFSNPGWTVLLENATVQFAIYFEGEEQKKGV